MNLYTTYSDFLKKHFDGKVQKLPVDVANTCPVRDGTIARGGCDFCNARSLCPNAAKMGATCSNSWNVERHFHAQVQRGV